jgi:hypothetical protein
MKRREFIAGLGSTAAWPVVVRAQQSERMRRIGVFSYESENDVHFQEVRQEFTARLHELGWIEGRNLEIDYRFADNDVGRLNTYAQELVALQPDVIFAPTSEAVTALHATTRTIPIVFAGGTDPVAKGLVASMARPGGNVTGFSNNVASIATKRLQLLKQIAPRTTQIALMYDPLRATWLVASSSGVLPTTILRSANDSVRFSASAMGSPSADASMASASSMSRMRAVCRRRFLGALPATTFSDPPGNRRCKRVLRSLRPGCGIGSLSVMSVLSRNSGSRSETM